MGKLKTYIFFGQSNMDGADGIGQVPAADIERWVGQAIPFSGFPVDIQVPGIHMWTCELPHGGSGTLSLATYKGAFRKLTFHYEDPGVTTYATGFEYPNFKSTPLLQPGYYTATPTIGPVVEASWQLRHDAGEDVWVIHLAIGSTYASQFLGTIAGTAASWFNPALHNDWHPGSTSRLTGSAIYDLFDILVETILKGTAANWVTSNRPDDQIDVQGIFSILGESDSMDQVRADLFEQNFTKIRDTMRERIASAGLSSLPAHKIPWIAAGAKESVWALADQTNEIKQRMAADDLWSGYVDVNDLDKMVTSPAHFTAPASIELAKRMVDEWRRVRLRASSATTPEAERLTLGTLRSLVRRRYQFITSDNSLTDERLDEAINNAHRSIYKRGGDNIWFLKRIEPVTWTVGPCGFQTMPAPIRVVVRVERPDLPGFDLPWNAAGYDEQGRIRIQVKYSGSLFHIHHRLVPRDLSGENDVSLIPSDYQELVVLMACLQIAEASGNSQQIQYWMSKSMILEAEFKQDCARHERQRQNTIQASLDVFGAYGPAEFGGGF